ncbi:carbohydrate-binding module family 1 protein [Pleomassaria siparia CBS 279.74]|uniref:alpha-galactosidase n=1 Tax=Pleomassaria siparia CBS 279.74 TaxID=1314801 RepID=A0A6G1K3M3_9PLEO|nr:carbohydrate-binding module family 1 protein [Pleomassaria siparia CBS 279.74]
MQYGRAQAFVKTRDVTFLRGQKWQIILTGIPDISKSPLPPMDAPVWDIDLLDNNVATITALKASGKIVICYFSAGTWEDWRDDAGTFPMTDLGKVLPEWPNEKWIRTGSSKIREIMAKRIKIGAEKGCDAIDPDNTGTFPQQNDNGLNLKNTDLVDYMKWLQKEAAKYGMKIGLKNSLDIIPTVSPYVDFAVNEQCAQLNECNVYDAFLASNKPVFHIEYPTPLTPAQANTTLCTGTGTDGMSTVLKPMILDGTVIYCDGSIVNTPTNGTTNPTRPPRPPTTPRPTPTTRPGSPPVKTSSAKPTSTPGNGGGCKQKHWDQCGGNNWKGCTLCESPYTCKGVSPPYYYQCL